MMETGIELDCRGLSCPLPVVKVQKAMGASPVKAIMVLVDSEVAKENLSRLAAARGYSLGLEKTDGVFRLTLRPRRGESPQEQAQGRRGDQHGRHR